MYNDGSHLWKDNGDGTFTKFRHEEEQEDYTMLTVDTWAGDIKDFFSHSDDKLYFLNGQYLHSMTGTTSESILGCSTPTGYELTNVHKCTMHEWYGGAFKHFYAGNPADASRVYFSEDNDPLHVKTANSVVPTANLGKVTALKAHEDQVLVFYQRGIFRWAGGASGVLSADWHMIPASSGATSNKAVVGVREKLVYTAEDGVYILESLDTRRQNNARKISADIGETYKNLVNKDKMAAVFDGRYLFIACCDGKLAYNNTVLVADFDLLHANEIGELVPAWSVFTNCYVNDFMFISGENVVYFAHANNGLVMKFDPTYFNNDDEPLHMKAEHYLTLTDRYGVINPFAVHRIKQFLIAAKQYQETSTCKVKITCDYDDKTMDIDLNESFIWGKKWGLRWGWVDVVTKQGKINEKARRVKVTIENNNLDETFGLYAFGINYNPGRTKGEKQGVNYTS